MLETQTQTKEAMGTVFEIKLPSIHAHVFELCFLEIERIEKTYSRFLSDSTLSTLNQSRNTWVELDSEFFEILEKAQYYHKQTHGFFNIALKSQLDHIGYDAAYSFKPKAGMHHWFGQSKYRFKRFIRKFIGAYSLNKATQSVYLRDKIEIGGFGKGFALDCVVKIMQTHGVLDYYINAGGDVCAKGAFDIVLLENPNDATLVIGDVVLNGRFIAASAGNKRKWGKNGEVHHLLNPKTGLSAKQMKAVFIIGESGIDADAYATALFSMGFSRACRFAKSHNLSVLLVSVTDDMFLHNFKANLYW
jgi:FAD:protein FMN transferase